MKVKLQSSFQESLDQLDLDSLLLLISILSQKALFLHQATNIKPSPIVKPEKPIIL